MATPEQLAQFRRMIGELTNAAPWDDAYCTQVIDASSSLNAAATRAWEEKAAIYAGMIDTTESGSSRRLSQLQAQALNMAGYYRKLTEGEAEGEDPTLTGYAYVVQIERP